jgi:hypothetical protein
MLRFRIAHYQVLVLMVVFMAGFLFAPATLADTYQAVLDNTSIAFRPSAIFIDQTIRIYATVYNQGDEDVEGKVKVYDSGELIGEKIFSAKASGKPDELWVEWTPKKVGDHELIIQAVNDPEFPNNSSIDNQYIVTKFVDRDTDGDGLGDSVDPDDDNDGVPDNLDQFPTDPTRSHDADGDGIDDKVDSDADNDGLYNFQEKSMGTNPLKRDTDGDGVGDNQDAFPLDPRRSIAEPEPKPVPVVTSTIPEPEIVTQDAVSATVEGLRLPAITESTATVANAEPVDLTPTEFTVTAPEPIVPIPSNNTNKIPSSVSSWLLGFAGFTGFTGFLFFLLDRRKEKDKKKKIESENSVS